MRATIIDLGGPTASRCWRVVAGDNMDDARSAAIFARVTGSVGATFNNTTVRRIEPVFICEAVWHVPETRVDLECEYREFLGVFATKESAEAAFTERLAECVYENAQGDIESGVSENWTEALTAAVEYVDEEGEPRMEIREEAIRP